MLLMLPASSLFSFAKELSVTPSFPELCHHHLTLLRAVLDPPGVLIFVGLSHLPCPGPDCSGIEHLQFLITIQWAHPAGRHSPLHILLEDALAGLWGVCIACWVGTWQGQGKDTYLSCISQVQYNNFRWGMG